MDQAMVEVADGDQVGHVRLAASAPELDVMWARPTDGTIAARESTALVADLERAGFSLVPGGKGSHRKFRHPKLAGSVILSGHDGDDAKHYQEKQIRNAIHEANK